MRISVAKKSENLFFQRERFWMDTVLKLWQNFLGWLMCYSIFSLKNETEGFHQLENFHRKPVLLIGRLYNSGIFWSSPIEDRAAHQWIMFNYTSEVFACVKTSSSKMPVSCNTFLIDGKCFVSSLTDNWKSYQPLPKICNNLNTEEPKFFVLPKIGPDFVFATEIYLPVISVLLNFQQKITWVQFLLQKVCASINTTEVDIGYAIVKLWIHVEYFFVVFN